jgi:hypothetical protein
VKHTTPLLVACAVALGSLAGCGGGDNQPDFPALHPAKGVIKRGGQPVKGGVVRFTPDPDKPEFVINSEVGADGTFALSTVRSTDKKGERKPGAPAGSYKVTYTPSLGDQTATAVLVPVDLPKPIAIQAGENDISIDLPAKK